MEVITVNSQRAIVCVTMTVLIGIACYLCRYKISDGIPMIDAIQDHYYNRHILHVPSVSIIA